MPRMSVIVAGATGATGRCVVSQLVTHPDVGRVVALSRFPIHYDKWPDTFPGIRMADALRQLSVVPIDWDQISCDAAKLAGGMPLGSGDCAVGTGGGTGGDAKSHTGPVGDRSPLCPPLSADGSTSLRGGTNHEALYRLIFSGHHIAVSCLGSHTMWHPRSVTKVDHDYPLAFARLVRHYNYPVCVEHPAAASLSSSATSTAHVTDSSSFSGTAQCCPRPPEDALSDDERREILTACGLVETGTQTSTDGLREAIQQVREEAGIASSSAGGGDTLENDPLDFGSAAAELQTTAAGSVRDGATSGGGFSGVMSVARARERTLRHFACVSVSGATAGSRIPYFRVHGTLDDTLMQLFQHPRPAEFYRHGETLSTQLPPSLSVWRPGLLSRTGGMRWVELLLSKMAQTMTTEELASVMVQYLIERGQCKERLYFENEVLSHSDIAVRCVRYTAGSRVVRPTD